MSEISFEQMELSPKTYKAIEEMGYSEPSPIQATAIPIILKGKDIIGQAQTGTGKTAAFGIPIIEMIDPKNTAVQAVVLTPTRELAVQVSEEINKIAKHHKGVSVIPVYGGQDIGRQIRALKQGVQVVIGTPGRMIDHINRRTLRLHSVKMIILDEADEMLDMGFLDDIREILKAMTAEEKQTIMFSATMPPEILELAKKFQKEPEIIKVVHKELTVPMVKQFYYEVREGDKVELLSRLFDFYNPKLAIVFVKTKIGAEALKEKIHASGYSVEGLHGDMKQTQRDYVMKRFRNRDFEILIATDVAARGIDVDDIDIVFNYDLPQDEEYYVHRIGRTARAGKNGMAVSFVTMREFRKLKEIERFIKARIERRNIPTMKDVEQMRNQAFVTSIRESIEAGELDKYVTMITETLGDYTSIEVAAALMKMMDDKKTTSSNIDERVSAGGGGDRSDPDFVRFFITIGKKDRIGIKDLLGFIKEKTNISGKDIGDIAFLEKFSFVNIPSALASRFTDNMVNAKFQGKRIHVEVANKRQ